MDEQMISKIVSALQNADLHDGDEGNHYRLFDLLGFSGENKSVMITQQLARAAHSVMSERMAELEEAMKPFADKADYADALEADDDDYIDCAPFQAGEYRKARAALAPHPKDHE